MADRWTEEVGLTADDDVSLMRERDYLVLARVLLARSNPCRALRLLDRLDDLAASQDRNESLIQIRAVRSLALQSAGDHKGALTALADALSLARPEGYVRVFADEGPKMGGLLQSLIRTRERGPNATVSGAAREHMNRVARAFRAPAGLPVSATAATRPVVPLTRREREVLALVAVGKPNREIADQLVVTLDTVKKHLSNIFEKLGAANRTEAVARAREFGLTE